LLVRGFMLSSVPCESPSHGGKPLLVQFLTVL